jgi:hypothetical protein
MKKKNTYKIFVGQPDKAMNTQSTTCRRESNIKIVLKDRGCEDVDWGQVAHPKVLWQYHLNGVNIS